jgi:hypothetical protein
MFVTANVYAPALMGRGYFSVYMQGFSLTNPPRKDSLVTAFRECPIV